MARRKKVQQDPPLHEIGRDFMQEHDYHLGEIIKNHIDENPNDWHERMKPIIAELDEKYSAQYPSWARTYGNKRPELLNKKQFLQGNVGLDIQAQKYD